MSDETIFPNDEEGGIDDAFSQMESSLDALPEGDFITLRHEANAPVYSPVYAGEPNITIRTACERRGLTLGASVQAYVDNNLIALDTAIPAGSVVTLVGNVKGG